MSTSNPDRETALLLQVRATGYLLALPVPASGAQSIGRLLEYFLKNPKLSIMDDILALTWNGDQDASLRAESNLRYWMDQPQTSWELILTWPDGKRERLKDGKWAI